MGQKMPGSAGWASAWENVPTTRATSSDQSAWLWCCVIVLCVGQVLLWGAAYGLAQRPPGIDGVVDPVASTFSLDSGYWAHSALGAATMRAMVAMFGASAALPFVATQISIVVALTLVWRLGCEFMSPRRSLIAMLLTSLLAFRIGAEGFSHDTALLPFQAALLLLFYRASRHGHWGYWVLTGLFAALAMRVHPMALLALSGLLLYVVLDHRMHGLRQVLGLCLAAGVFALVMLLQALWMPPGVALDMHLTQSLAQALPGAPRGVQSTTDVLLGHGRHLLPFLATLWFVLGRRGGEHIWSAPPRCASAGDRLYLWVAALAPIGLTMLVAMVSASEPQLRWGASGLLVAGWLVMAMLRRGDCTSMLRRALGFVICAHLVVYLSLTMGKLVVSDATLARIRSEVMGRAW